MNFGNLCKVTRIAMVQWREIFKFYPTAVVQESSSTGAPISSGCKYHLKSVGNNKTTTTPHKQNHQVLWELWNTFNKIGTKTSKITQYSIIPLPDKSAQQLISFVSRKRRIQSNGRGNWIKRSYNWLYSRISQPEIIKISYRRILNTLVLTEMLPVPGSWSLICIPDSNAMLELR